MILSIILGLAGGAAFGYGLYRFVGCRTGSCPITANPYTSIAYGMVLGLLIAFAR